MVTIQSPATGLLVCNTTTAGAGATAVTPGFYYWDGTKWVRFSVGNEAWKITGNAGTVNGTHFLGTTDAQDLDIRTNDIIRVRITQNSQIEVLNSGLSVFIGEGAGASDDLSNNGKIFIGYLAGNSNTGSWGNTASGYRAFSSNTTGFRNVAIGTNALFSNTTGVNNTANGGRALYFNTTGNNNTAIGYNALYNTTTSSNLVAVGYLALYNNRALGNTAVGSQSLYTNSTGDRNTAVGYQSLYSNTTGLYNTATGYQVLFPNTTGLYNTAMGYYALYSNTTGRANVANGLNALFSNTTGQNNIAIGNNALYNSSNGYQNIAVGGQSMYNTTTGDNNTAIGNVAMISNTPGFSNTAVGSYSLNQNTTGYNNTAVGASAYLTGTFNNSTALGYNTIITASNQVRVGNTAVTDIGGYAAWNNLSDGRFKTQVQENVPGLALVMQLRPITYHLNIEKLNEHLRIPDSLRLPEAEAQKEQELQIGFIAQDVEKAAQLLDFDFHAIDKPKNEGDYYGLRYAEFVPVLVKAIQEQQKIIEKQQRQIDELKEKLQELMK